MKTRYDDRDELLCTQDCEYDGTVLRAGEVILSGHPAARFMPENFKPLSVEEAVEMAEKAGRRYSLREEHEVMARRVEELARQEVREKYEKERAGNQSEACSEGAFWDSTARFMENRALPDLDEIGDPAREAEEEHLVEQQRIAQLPDPAGERFWDEAEALIQRIRAEEIFPAHLREGTEELGGK
jgi:hypothetical protein